MKPYHFSRKVDITPFYIHYHLTNLLLIFIEIEVVLYSVKIEIELEVDISSCAKTKARLQSFMRRKRFR